jgi:hypothetical protein
VGTWESFLRTNLLGTVKLCQSVVPEDVASLVFYLGSGANGHVNGEHIRVTGGCSLPLMAHLWKEARDRSLPSAQNGG